MDARKEILKAMTCSLVQRKKHLEGHYKFDDLKNKGFTSQDMQEIVNGLNNLGNLDSLTVDCSENQIDDEAVACIAEWFKLGFLPNTFTLNLSKNCLSPLGVQCLQAATAKYGKEKWVIDTSHNLSPSLANSSHTSQQGLLGQTGPSATQAKLRDLLAELQRPAIQVALGAAS